MLASALALSSLLAVTGAPAPTAPLRHLVYTFTYGSSTTVETQVAGFHDSGNPSGMNGNGTASGMASNSGGTTDQGTITVDVLREQADKGLVVSISEQARDNRSANAATCVVFANTFVVCDSSAKVNDEEVTLLRLLGSNFVDPANLDNKKHWQVSPQDETADFTISSVSAGIMKIDSQQVIKGQGGRSNTINGSITYDFNRQVPTAISTYSVDRTQSGEQYTSSTINTVLTLQSDSMATSAAKN